MFMTLSLGCPKRPPCFLLARRRSINDKQSSLPSHGRPLEGRCPDIVGRPPQRAYGHRLFWILASRPRHREEKRFQTLVALSLAAFSLRIFPPLATRTTTLLVVHALSHRRHPILHPSRRLRVQEARSTSRSLLMTTSLSRSGTTLIAPRLSLSKKALKPLKSLVTDD